MGSCAALELSTRGNEVTVYEQFPFGHDRGSSHGRSRIIRKAYPEQLYARIMVEGWELWMRLQHDSGARLIHECGLLFFGRESSENIKSQVAALEELDIEHKVLGASDCARVLPQLQLAPGEVGVWTRDGGWASADLCVLAIRRLAESRGARFLLQKVDDASELLRSVDRVALCTGAWMAGDKSLGLTSTLQNVFYVRGTHGGPVWIEECPDHPYGFPNEPGASTFKLALHTPGAIFDPDDTNRPPDLAARNRVIEVCRKRFGIANPEVTEVVSCLYTSTANEDFRIAWVADNVLAVSPCSGHGFKFGPWIGRYVADLCEGKCTTSEYPRFSRGHA